MVTFLVGGFLMAQATQLKMKPFRDYKREFDLAEYRRRKGL